MEPVFQAHPIPQNVTNFEFHLVGDMTLKQFGYLAAGLGFAFLIFTTLSTVQPIIAWPIIIISALLGVAFAFLPIQERPLDHWVSAFFRAIFKPTSLKYSSKIISPEDPLFNRRLGHYLRTYKYNEAKQKAPLGNPNLLPSALMEKGLNSTSMPPKLAPSQMGQKKPNFIEKFKAGQTSFTAPAPQHPHSIPPQPNPLQTVAPMQTISIPTPPSPAKPSAPFTAPAPPTPQAPANLKAETINLQSAATPTPGILHNPNMTSESFSHNSPSGKSSSKENKPSPNSGDLKKTVELASEAQDTQKEIIKIEASLSQLKQQAAQPGTDPQTYLEEFQDLLTQLQKLNEKASKTAQRLAEVSGESKPVLQSVQTIIQNAPPIKAQSIPTMKLTSFPNVINGIVTDSEGNYLEGAIIVAHDKQGLPVRALKSNKLGQFVAATPLPSGQYSIVVEKENLNFDKAAVELKNEVLPPILIAAKKLSQGTG